MIRQFKTSILFLAVMTFLLGLVYPCAVWLVGTILFPREAAGSLVFDQGKIIGSELIAQPFSADRYFWPRPSATTGGAYEPLGSGASNMNPANPALIDRIRLRTETIKHAQASDGLLPADLVTASGSGLDPHLSPEAAAVQINRIAKARDITPHAVQTLLQEHTEDRTFGFLGMPRVNVLKLNMALDRLSAGPK